MRTCELETLAETVLSAAAGRRWPGWDDEEEIRQDAFLELAGKRPWEVAPEIWDSSRRWAYVARRLAWVRQGRRRRARRSEALRERFARERMGGQSTESPAEVAQRSEEVAFLREGLGALPDRQREALRLWSDEGLSYEEMATRLGIPRNTLASEIRRALQKLRGHLGPR